MNIFTISDHFIKVVFPFPDKNIIDGIEKNVSKGKNGTINGTINSLDEAGKNIIAKMVEMPHITIKAMSECTGYSVRKINRIIKELKEMGIVERKGANKTGYWVIRK